MKLLLRRDQKSGLMGKITFILDVRADLSDEERAHIDKYRLDDVVLYERSKIPDPSQTALYLTGVAGVAWKLAHKMTNLTIKVNDLTKGKRVDCKDIVEMLAAEEQIKEAATTFKQILSAAAGFGGEEVLEV